MTRPPSLLSALLGAALIATLTTGCSVPQGPPEWRAVLVSKGQLYAVALGEGADLQLPAQPVTFDDLARQPRTNDLYAAARDGLYTVDRSTGQATLVGPWGPGVLLNALAFSPDGQLFGGDEYGRFYRIDPATGQTTSQPLNPPVIGFAGDLAAAPDGTLYATVAAPLSNRLVTIDPTTGAVNDVGLTGFDDVYGLSFRGDALYGVTHSGEVLTIDRRTGAGRLLRETGLRGVSGLE